MTLKEWIKAERKAGRHWTQERVAAHLGMSKITLNRIVMGKIDPRLSVVRDIEKLTGGAVGLADWPVRKDAA